MPEHLCFMIYILRCHKFAVLSSISTIPGCTGEDHLKLSVEGCSPLIVFNDGGGCRADVLLQEMGIKLHKQGLNTLCCGTM